VSLPPFAEAASIGEAPHHFESHPAAEFVSGEEALALLFGISLNAPGRIVHRLHLILSGSPTPFARNQSDGPVGGNGPIS
jgi:hypothetical protein